MVYGVIYVITNKLNGMKYVGQTTISVERRFNQHAKNTNSAIGEAIQTHGRRNFTIEIIEECVTREQLCERERFWILNLNSKYPNGYNLTGGGETGRGVKLDRNKPKHDYLTFEQGQELIAKMPAETEMQLRNKAIVSLMVTSGLRCCEVQKALYEDLRTAGDTEVLYIQGKGHSCI